MKKIFAYLRAHRVLSIIGLVVVLGGGYWWYSASHGAVAVTKYVIGTASQGTVVASVSGSGQVQAVTELDVKPQATETVTKVYVKPGDHVTAGEALVQLDTTNEQKALTQAQLSYQSSQISLEKLQEAPATTTLTQDQDAVTQAQQTLVNASNTLARDYESGFDSISSNFVDFQAIMAQLQDFAQGTDLSKGQANPDVLVNLMPTYLQASTTPYRDNVISSYDAAFTAYQQNLSDYHNANRNSNPTTLDSLFSESYTTAKLIGNAVTAVENMLNFMTTNYPPKGTGTAPLPSFVTTNQTTFGGYVNSVNGDITNALNAGNTISADQSALSNDQESLTEKQQSLTSLTAGPDPLDVQSQNLSLEQQQFAVQTAQQNLADDTIRAPIDGTVATVPAIVGEDVPSPAVTIVGSGEEAQVTLNEVDAAKVSVGQPATLTFDAIDGLSLAGQVVEIDPVGTVSQGVVNYNVEVGFTQDPNVSSSLQVKPGFSVTANIVTNVHQDVVVVPNSAVKTQGITSYVLEPASPVSSTTLAASATGGVILDAAPKMVPVTVGLSDDTNTEIVSGVSPGDQVITATMQSTVASAGAASGGTSALRLLGGAAGGGAGATFGGGAGGGGFTRPAGGGVTTGK